MCGGMAGSTSVLCEEKGDKGSRVWLLPYACTHPMNLGCPALFGHVSQVGLVAEDHNQSSLYVHRHSFLHFLKQRFAVLFFVINRETRNHCNPQSK